MMEHAQMEETLLFPFFDAADRGNNILYYLLKKNNILHYLLL
jgi:hypothetical protein